MLSHVRAADACCDRLSGDCCIPALCNAAFSVRTEITFALSVIGKVKDLDKYLLTCQCLGKCIWRVSSEHQIMQEFRLVCD